MTDYFKHPMALVESENIGRGTRVWAFTHILPGASIGADCNIGDHVFIENEVVVGDRVTVKCGVQLWDGLTLEDDVFVGPNVTFANDPFPRSRCKPDRWIPTIVHKGASINANATVLPGLVIGANAMVEAGSVVTRNVPAFAVVMGNPAVIKSYASTLVNNVQSATKSEVNTPMFELVPEVRAYRLPIITDLRGSISVGELGKGMPFLPKRYFTVFDVPTREVRGEHAHRTCHQFLVCVRGQVNLVVDNGQSREELVLDSPSLGVHIPPMIWAVQYQYSSEAVLLVLTSDAYDAADYIRDYDEFRRLGLDFPTLGGRGERTA